MQEKRDHANDRFKGFRPEAKQGQEKVQKGVLDLVRCKRLGTRMERYASYSEKKKESRTHLWLVKQRLKFEPSKEPSLGGKVECPTSA